ncbi:MAG: extracellular solute-binding protein [Opitutales bacterium]|jgi:microcin C transport system substrate-binding protein
MKPYLSLFSAAALSGVLALLFCTGCSGAKDDAANAAGNSPEALSAEEQAVIDAYYAGKPDFFTFATIDDLPKDLVWEDGHEEMPFADPHAVRGGTVRSFMLSWPPTLRFVGPDANHSMRGVFLDENKMSLCDLHPITRRWIPGLATAWAVSKDKRTVYYRLDPDATYSDGVPVNADDYLYTFYFMQSPCINAPWYNNWYGESYSNITKYDQYTISVTLPEAKPDPVYYTALSPTPAHFYRILNDKFVEEFQWKFEPTTGPWELKPENMKQGESITVTRVKDWWANDKKFYAHRHNPDRRKFTLIRDYQMAFEAFKKGDIDMFGLTLPEFWYDGTENIEAVKKGWINRAVYYNDVPQATIGLYLNRANPLLADKLVRQGIQFACNWKKVMDFHFRGDYARLKGEVDGFGDFDHPTLRARTFDPDKARALFAEAGFDKAGPDGVLVDAHGRRLSFAVSMAASPNTKVVEILKQEALRAGLEFDLDVQDPTTNYKKTQSKQHDIAFMGWNVGLPYPRFWENYHSVNAYDVNGKIAEQTNNMTSTADPELDVMIDKYRALENIGDMVALAHQIEEYLYDEASFVPGYKMPFYRLGYWAWMKFPEGFDVPLSEGPSQYGLYWIDQKEKDRVMEAVKNGTDLGEKTEVFGQKPE